MSTSQQDESIIKDSQKYSKKWLLTPWESSSIFSNVSETHQDYPRSRWRVAKRVVTEKIIPLNSVSKEMAPTSPISISSIDPWATDHKSLLESSKQIISCNTCHGEKIMNCPDCKGTTKVRCYECSGSGYVPGKRSGTIKKCPRCKATGQRKCTECKSGKVDCKPCNANGVMQRWLEIQETFDEQTFGQDKAPGGHKNYAWPTFEETAKPNAELPFELVLSWKGEKPEDAPPEVQTWLNFDNLRPSGLDSPALRVKSVELQVARISMKKAHFRLAGKDGFVSIDPQQNLILPSESELGPFKKRLWVIGASTVLVHFVSFNIVGKYLSQHPFYEANGMSGLLNVFAWLCVLSTVILSALLCLPKSSEHRKKLIPSGITLGAMLLLLIGSTNFGHPSASHAKDLLQAGKEDVALVEIDAAIKLNRDKEKAMDLHDEIHLAKLKQTKTAGEASQYVGFKFYWPESHQQAVNHSIQLAEKELKADYSKKAYESVESGYMGLPDEVRNSSAIKTMYTESVQNLGKACIQKANIQCIGIYAGKLKQAQAPEPIQKSFYKLAADKVSSEATRILSSASSSSFEAKEKACGQFDELMKTAFEEIKLDSIIDIKEKNQATCKKWADEKAAYIEAEAERKRQAEEYARRQAEIAEEQRQAAEERQRMKEMYPNGVLMCNDGTESPTCSCPGKRGCCSHHGGVAGCKYY